MYILLPNSECAVLRALGIEGCIDKKRKKVHTEETECQNPADMKILCIIGVEETVT